MVISEGEGDKQQCVARASEENELVTGGVCKGESACVPYYGVAQDCEVYQCLVMQPDCGVYWVPVGSPEEVPECAMQCGVNNDGVRIFVTRAKVNDSADYCAGKLAEGSGEGYFACDDEEVPAQEFEVLCVGDDAEGLDGAAKAVLCE